ncbi:hypothetical protein [Streptomyces sp. Ag109_G2-15]|uniref:hypothetical protein n=1 Tax=Streptomyces sp. Ag109_G2-15 TaxID=1938850 RepID=UPI000BCF4A49|nr:hypothetical protein [Streptomyces sp. Ag109_G2-15]SOD86154.1 hypothetical protein SAMN06272765_3599 [Streptomyces sp. Ag109_G2-15]
MPKMLFETALRFMKLQPGLTAKQAVAKAKKQNPMLANLDTKELERKLEEQAAKDAAKANPTAAAKPAGPAPGVYFIRRSDNEYLTLQGGNPSPGKPVEVERFRAEPAQQRQVEMAGTDGSGTTHTLCNLAVPTYLGYDGKPQANMMNRGPGPAAAAHHYRPRTLRQTNDAPCTPPDMALP